MGQISAVLVVKKVFNHVIFVCIYIINFLL